MAQIDESKLQAFVGKALEDLAGAASALLVFTGDKLGLYKAMAGAGPMTSAQLAEKTGTTERYVREWLRNQAAGGYVTYDAAADRYTLPPEHAMALANEDSPAFIAGAFSTVMAAARAQPRVFDAFRSGKGVGWHEHDPVLFEGTERFFRPLYNGSLISSWIPALEGVDAKLKAGGKAADIGCGHGSSTIILAQAYPKSTFCGFDYHQPSIAIARQRAAQAGLADRVTFEAATAKNFPGHDYDLIAFFDCLHDMGDPVGAAAHTRKALKSDGTMMLVEPFAEDGVEGNLNPRGRLMYGISTMVCTPASLAQEVGLALGAQAGETRLREVVTEAGFTRFRRAIATPFNLVLEIRP
jgi:SAM-dependent methyltransferase